MKQIRVIAISGDSCANCYSVSKQIMSFKDTYKDVMYYHFVMELPVIKIAKLLGQTVPATQKQLVRGKKLLLNLLGIQGVENNVDEQR